MVKIQNQNASLVVAIKLDQMLEGEIAYLPTFDTKLDVKQFFADGFRFASVSIEGAK